MAGALNFALILRAVDLASGPLTKVAATIMNAERAAAGARHLRELGGRMQETGAKFTASGAAMAASMLPAITAFKDQEAALTAMKIAFMEEGGTVSPFFNAVSAKVIEISNRLPGTTSDFARMAQALREQGVSADKIAGGILSATANIKALMPRLAPEEAAEYMAIFQESLGVAEHDFEKFVDVVQRGKFAFGIDPGSMAYTLKYIGPLISNLGMGGLEGSKSFYALSGVLAQAGVSGEKLGTTLRETLSHLPDLEHKLKKNAELKKILGDAGIDLTFFDHGKFIGMENLVVQMEKLRVLNDQDQLRVLKKLFGEEAMTSLAVLVKKGVGGYNEAVDKLAAQATLEQRTTEILTTLQARWETATGNIENMMAVLGRTFEAELKGAADWIATTAAATGDWIEANAELVKPLGLAVAGTAALTLTLGAGGLVLGTFVKGLGFSLSLFSSFARGAYLATAATLRFSAATLTLVGGGLKAIPGALWAAGQAMTAGFLAATGSAVRGVLLLSAAMSSGVAAMAAWTRAAFFTRAGLVGLATAPFRLAVAGLRLVASGLWSLATAPFRLIAGGFNLVIGAVRATTVALLANPIGLAAAAIAAAAVLIYKYWEPIKGFFIGLWTGVTEAMRPVLPALDRLATAAGPVLSRLIPLFQGIADTVRGLFGWLGRLLEPVEDVGGAAEKMGERWGRVIGGMLTAVVQLGPKLVQAGVGLIDELWKGIASKVDWLIGNFTAMVPQGLRNLLNGSPAKEGPLRTVAEGGMGLVSELERGLAAKAPGFIDQFQAMLPDRITKSLGAATAAGMALLAPMGDAAAMPGMTSPTLAGSGLASPALVSVAAAGGPGGAATAGPVTVTINIAMQGDPGSKAGEKVADAVKAQMPDIVAAMRAEEARQKRVGY
jgi:TP901 family phage tail tape measure protein